MSLKDYNSRTNRPLRIPQECKVKRIRRNGKTLARGNGPKTKPEDFKYVLFFDSVISFGIYKTKTIQDVIDIDIDYIINWDHSNYILDSAVIKFINTFALSENN